jgi:hypothetical protein
MLAPLPDFDGYTSTYAQASTMQRLPLLRHSEQATKLRRFNWRPTAQHRFFRTILSADDD